MAPSFRNASTAGLRNLGNFHHQQQERSAPRLGSQGPKADSTLRSSQAVPHPSTNRALSRLTSEVERDPVYWTRYGRQRKTLSGSAKTSKLQLPECVGSVQAVSKGLWRNGSASDSRSEGWEFESLWPHLTHCSSLLFKAPHVCQTRGRSLTSCRALATAVCWYRRQMKTCHEHTASLKVCACRESNPGHKHGRLVCYRYTTCASDVLAASNQTAGPPGNHPDLHRPARAPVSLSIAQAGQTEPRRTKEGAGPAQKEGSCSASVQQRPLFCILVQCPTTAGSAQFCLLCCQPGPVPGSSSARRPQITLWAPCRLPAWLGWTIHMHPRACWTPHCSSLHVSDRVAPTRR